MHKKMSNIINYLSNQSFINNKNYNNNLKI